MQKHERQAQQHYQQLQRKKREEEERQRQAEHVARRERERDESRSDSSGDHHHDRSHSSKPRSGGGGSGGLDKPKRPSSLLANNNVMKLKQIIPLQSKFSSGGARSPQSPTGSEPKLPGFLSFKFLKSPENKKDGAAAAAAGASTSTHAAAAAVASSSSSSSASSGSSSQERSLSPSKAFNPGKLFNFGKSEVGVCVNGAAPPKGGEGLSDRPPSRSDLNCVPDEIPSPGGDVSENGPSADSGPPSSRA